MPDRIQKTPSKKLPLQSPPTEGGQRARGKHHTSAFWSCLIRQRKHELSARQKGAFILMKYLLQATISTQKAYFVFFPFKIAALIWMQLLCKSSRPNFHPSAINLALPLKRKRGTTRCEPQSSPQHVPTRASQPDKSSPGKPEAHTDTHTSTGWVVFCPWAIFSRRVISGTGCQGGCSSRTTPGATRPTGKMHSKHPGFLSRCRKSSASQAANAINSLPKLSHALPGLS